MIKVMLNRFSIEELSFALNKTSCRFEIFVRDGYFEILYYTPDIYNTIIVVDLTLKDTLLELYYRLVYEGNADIEITDDDKINIIFLTEK